MNKTRLMPILIVIAIGVVLAGLILLLDKPSAVTAEMAAGDASGIAGENQPDIGPRGGKLFTGDGFGLELTIFEKGVPPQFRIYLYENGKPLPPAAAKVSIALTRLGAPVQLIKFAPEADYLLGDQVVEEPHSFDLAIAAERNGQTFRWGSSQVEARLEMTDEMLKTMGVEIQTAGPAIVKSTLKLPGEIVFNPDRIVQVVPRLPGVVAEVNFEPGQMVKKGDVLAVIESQMLADLHSQYMAAQKRLSLARTVYQREKQLWEEKISAKQDYLAAELVLNEAQIAVDLAAEKLKALGVRPEPGLPAKALTRYEVRAPISGLIITRTVALGAALKEDITIFTVADMSTVWTAVTVYPKDLSIVRVGQKALVKATAFDVEGEGVVTYITTLIGGQTRTATARVILDNKDGRWHPGMFVNIELVSDEIEVPVAVSAQAIQTFRDWTVVFGRYGGYLEARPLELGRSDGKMVEVLKGFAAGERYASGNSFAIKADIDKAGASHDH
ncbi:efflux RND transporter periplasmic adaptor subunit [Nitrosomonas oligotropha]|uniref:Membrane fusion protein, cobalt-zinc-cadmium efflux system n=1 Tax=Nitrosomonas oligotropha TaxID=42354 RepID=A0A1H8M1M1_9PROT|nr:efflux RND transporter periplasmic adaptor subunit [Nitrosomonas oligotropha]SDW36953.1 membrane fusion protein, cobalt-zinc-cadmium efflux system [Nitrosomonas oligotropha]SEO11038.1 membrane fusion protein, cobalt-zinc-cadmium efflux system [Nitrosomonas oligotropha]